MVRKSSEAELQNHVMAKHIDQSFAASIADGCEEPLGQSDLVVARLKDAVEIDTRTIRRGEVAEFVRYIAEQKQEDEEVLVWTADKIRNDENWSMHYPVRMQAFHREGRESVRRRRAVAFDEMPDGFSLKTEGRSGYLYYREEVRMLEMHVEMSAVRKYSFILYWEDLEKWIFPDEVTIDDEEKARLTDLTKQWLTANDYSVSPLDA
jgi:hypothetical protein